MCVCVCVCVCACVRVWSNSSITPTIVRGGGLNIRWGGGGSFRSTNGWALGPKYSLTPAPTQGGFLKAQWMGVWSLHPLLSH